MLKRWNESRPFTFGSVFIFLYVTIPILDQIYLYPKMRPKCEEQITDEQVKTCASWIVKKETKHVRSSERRPRGMHRPPQENTDSEWFRTLDAYGRIPDKKS